MAARRASEVFAGRLKEERERIGISRSALARRLDDLGYRTKGREAPLTRRAIADIEDGDRVATVDDLIACAAALRVPPVSLLAPREHDEPTKAPNEEFVLFVSDDSLQVGAATDLEPFMARDWIRGYYLPPDLGNNESDRATYFYDGAPPGWKYKIDLALGHAEGPPLLDIQREGEGTWLVHPKDALEHAQWLRDELASRAAAGASPEEIAKWLATVEPPKSEPATRVYARRSRKESKDV